MCWSAASGGAQQRSAQLLASQLLSAARAAQAAAGRRLEQAVRLVEGDLLELRQLPPDLAGGVVIHAAADIRFWPHIHDALAINCTVRR